MIIDKNPPINVIVDTGILPKLVEFVIPNVHDQLAFEAVWCITNISCGEMKHVQTLLSYNIISRLVYILYNSFNNLLIEQCLWAVSNLATEPTGQAKQELIQLEIMLPLLWLLDINAPKTHKNPSPALSSMRYAAWTLCSLCK